MRTTSFITTLTGPNGRETWAAPTFAGAMSDAYTVARAAQAASSGNFSLTIARMDLVDDERHDEDLLTAVGPDAMRQLREAAVALTGNVHGRI